ncbi:MAG TPA: hypothetical protein VNH84_23000, partial [Candidatus Saccharimonadales bacterium]|nr:hypothetical protein [Candidatus Saccharimonadales bacterium]
MPEPELSLLFIRPLNRIGVRYLVRGSVAAILYGEPRLTHDVDFVVFLRPEDVSRRCSRLWRALWRPDTIWARLGNTRLSPLLR